MQIATLCIDVAAQVKRKGRMERVQVPVGLPEATDLDEAAETEEGIATDNNSNKMVAEAIPWDKIDQEYHGEIRELLVNKYPEIVSLGFWDTGETSKTLGKVHLPFARPGPGYPLCFSPT